jgi:ATP-dependent helicase/nuclease subunit A
MMNPAFELNGKPVSREEFYAVACDPRRSVAVEACAGAGKTWMLVSRILRALLEGCDAHEILAITFTKKAAGEMRQRLTDWLEEFSRASTQQLEAELIARGLSARAVRDLREPLSNLYRTLLAADRPVQIRTFHSWFAALLRAAPLAVLESLGLPAGYELLEDDAQAVELVWRRFYAALLNDAQARLDFEAVVANHGRFQTEKALTAALQRRVEFALADVRGVVAASVPPFSALFAELDGLAWPTDRLLQNHVRQRWLDWAQALGQEGNKTPQKAAAAIIEAFAELGAAGTDSHSAQANVLEKLRAAFFVSDEDRLTQHLKKFTAAQAAEVELQLLCAAQRQHEAWQYQQRMARLTRVLMAEFGALKRERGWVDMNDVERAALHLLADPVLGGWVQERLDARIRHLLIDEFQDTNPLQWQALQVWLSGYAGAGGGAPPPSVFIVGDPKQSIYRFRRAEPQVFIAAQQFVVQQLGGDLLSCDHTRRNAPSVMNLVNQTMVQAQSEGSFQGFRAHTTESNEDGAVLRLPQILRPTDSPEEEPVDAWRDSLTTPRELPEETLRTLECRQAARWLAAQIQGGLPPGEIMVLARKRDRLAVMQEELRALHIPAQQPEKTDLGQAPEVQDVVALLDVLVSPIHDLSLARALKSPLFGVSDEALVQLALLQRTRTPRTPWFDLLQSEELHATELKDLGLILMRWQGCLATLPPHDALDAIYRDGDVLARFAVATPATLREGVLSNLQALLLAALQIDGARYATPYALVRALKAGGVKAPARSDAHAVQLLTVHGAKGLEASLVLLLDTDAPAPKAQTMGVLVDWPGESDVPQNFMFLANETRPPISADGALAIERQAREREELNALYVAMTRARHRLVLSSVQPRHPNGASWWQRLWNGCSEFTPGATDVQVAVSVEAPIVLPVLPAFEAAEAQGVVKAGATLQLTEKPSLDSLIGQAMHRLLEWAPLGAQVCPEVQVQQAGSEFGLDTAQAHQAAAMAQRILTGVGAWAWDATQVDWHGNEVALTLQGNLRRLDRLVRLRSGDWWVLDYKSAAQPQARAELLTQLREYRAAVQAMYPDQPVKAAFLSAQGTLEEIE